MTKDDFTYGDFMDELMAFKYLDVCRLDGCDCHLGEYREDARFCSAACRAKAFREENKEWTKEYDKARNQDPVRRAKLYEYQARYLAKRELENG